MRQETWEATCAVQTCSAVQSKGGKAVAETGDVTTDGLGFIKGRKEGNRCPLLSRFCNLVRYRFGLVWCSPSAQLYK